MLSAGTRLGNFEIVAPLRSGGMAALYLAKRRGAAGFDRPVAIKVIHQHLATDRQFVEMFLDEARLAAKIQDPHVVHVEELGEDRGRYFLVMEFVHGRSLAELLKALAQHGRRMSPACAIHVAMQVARGLEAAHEARGADNQPLGVVHRDVSPQNILISFRGYVKLIDFGIAKARGQSHHTEADALKGKLAYMSPEQASGCEVDARTDIYALGIVLWEMLTNQRLFRAKSELALLDIVRAPVIPPPSSLVPGLSPDLDALVLAALERDLDRRIPTARELGRRLASLPEAAGVGNADLAALLAAVAPDDGSSLFGAPEPRPSADASKLALDTLSVISEERPRESEATGSTVLALERARDAALRWRRRAVGVGLSGVAAVAVVAAAAIAAPQRGAPESPAPVEFPPPAPPPETAAAAEPAPAPTAEQAAATVAPPSTSTAPKAPPRRRTHPARTARPARDAGSAAAQQQRSVEMINGVPMVRDDL